MGFWLRHVDLLLFILFCVAVPVLTVSAWLRRSRKWLRWLLTGLSAVELICVLYGFLIEPGWLEVSRHKHEIPGLEGSLRIVHLSDLHLDGDDRWQAEILAAVESTSPDLVFLTGDYLNDVAQESQLRAFLARLVELAGPQRAFAVTGNFELDGGPLDAFADAGVPLLDGVVVTVTLNGAAVQVAGIGFHAHQISEQFLSEVASQVEPSVPAVLLHHTPDLAESPGIEAFDFVFCGHTHGGQVRLPCYGALITLSKFGKRYEAGLYRLNAKTRIYVSRGLGNEPAPAPQVRFLCRPEVALFELGKR